MDFCVCVPARDEVAHIGTLIAALAEQDLGLPIPMALFVNNSSDETIRKARDAAAASSERVSLVVEERWLAADAAHAGTARRMAMDLGAASVSSDDAILISTDADCRPPRGWVRETLNACTDANRIVGGRIRFDEEEAIDPALLEIRQRIDRYWEAVRAIEDRIDPLPWDPAPRHGDHTGASLALSRGLYRRCGGVPAIVTGEDRALVAAAIAVGGVLVHPDRVWTRVSARVAGRAANGMADEMRRWRESARTGDALLVPSLAQWEARARWRRDARARGSHREIAALEAALPPLSADTPLPEASC